MSEIRRLLWGAKAGLLFAVLCLWAATKKAASDWREVWQEVREIRRENK